MSLFLYSVEREFPASIDAMWIAWTDSAALEQWYSPSALSVLPGSAVSEFASRDLTLAHHVIHVDFEERGDTAWVRFTQFGEMPAEEAAGAKEGMESYFDNLERFLTRT
jgi:uncharacterized protein YndB with AHSA1/START domain